MTWMYWVYILQSEKDKTYYVGFSENPEVRIQDHNWHISKYTSSRVPYKLVWKAAFQNKLKALAFEKYLKSSSGFAFCNKHLIWATFDSAALPHRTVRLISQVLYFDYE